jgi:hypothetical protein
MNEPSAIRRICWLACSAAVALVGAAAHADPPSPPQEAFTACANAKEGDACTVSMHGHDVSGTCSQFGTQGLACRPNRPPGPPPEAVAACASSKEGDSCTVTLHGESLSGTCRKGPSGQEPLACMPAGGPPPPP